ncbi:MAG: sensor histidine kinase [Candidatus Sericytochromatia bacterium]
MKDERAELLAENEALERRLAEAEAALATAVEARTRAVMRNAVLEKANDLLDRQLFRSTISKEVVKAAEASADLDQFCEAFFALISRMVRVERAGVRLQRQGFVTFCLHPPEDATLLQALEALAAEQAAPEGGARFSCPLGQPELPFGHFLGLAEEGTFSDADRALLEVLCREASPIFEHHMLIRLLQVMADYREEFVAMLSHDLRNPLTGVISSLSTLLVPGLPLEPAEREGLVRTALDSARMVNDMIGDLLDVAKLEAGRMPIEAEEVDLGALVETAVQAMQPLALAKGLAVAVAIPEDLPPVRGDDRKLLRVWINLLSNALKYTQRGGVVISLQAEAERVLATVADTGFGIPPEAQGRLFEKFYQVSNGQRGKVQGTGLGLAYCRQMIRAHGGRIWVESPSRAAQESGLLPTAEGGEGTAFQFYLPRWIGA